MACNWLMMTSSAEHHPRNIIRGGLDIVTDKTKKKTRPRCGLNRAVKLTVTRTVQLRFYLFANVQLVKRDIVTAVIYSYITTDFHYAKCDSHLSAYGAVMLQRVGIEKNVNRQLSLNF